MLSSRLILAARLRSAACGWCLIAMFGLPPAAAQVLYKSILPDGRAPRTGGGALRPMST
jgi:hypothetical protein